MKLSLRGAYSRFKCSDSTAYLHIFIPWWLKPLFRKGSDSRLYYGRTYLNKCLFMVVHPQYSNSLQFINIYTYTYTYRLTVVAEAYTWSTPALQFILSANTVHHRWRCSVLFVFLTNLIYFFFGMCFVHCFRWQANTLTISFKQSANQFISLAN